MCPDYSTYSMVLYVRSSLVRGLNSPRYCIYDESKLNFNTFSGLPNLSAPRESHILRPFHHCFLSYTGTKTACCIARSSYSSFPAKTTRQYSILIASKIMKIAGITVPVTCLFGSVSAFSTTPSSLCSTRHHSLSLPLFYADRQTDTFAAFADSLEEEPESDETWQERLESLLDPSTPLAQRQILMSELLSANQDIRDSVSAALRDRKVRERSTRVAILLHCFRFYNLTHFLSLYIFRLTPC